MPIIRPCRQPYCPAAAGRYGWCPAHDRPLYSSSDSTLPENWPALRRIILDRDLWRCQLCGVSANHVDHIIPRSVGGSDDPENLRALCAHCHHVESGRCFGRA